MALLWDLLRQRYPRESYALFREVGNATGFATRRHADAICVGLWPSRGLEVIGFEFKASRGDWKRELEQPEKAEAVCRYCDRWYVVATGKGIVERVELPKTWGLMIADGDKLRTVVEAPPLDPIPLDRKFVAAVCRAAQKAAEAEVEGAQRPLEEARHQAMVEVREKLRAEHAAAIEAARKDERRQWDGLREAMQEFQRLSGIDLFEIVGSRRWRLGRVAAAVKFLEEAERGARAIEHAAAEFAKLAEIGARAREELRAIEAATGGAP